MVTSNRGRPVDTKKKIMSATINHKNPPLTKVEWGVIVGFITILIGWGFVSNHMGVEKSRKDLILKEAEESIMDCIKAKRWSAPNKEELCRKADEKHAIAEREFGNTK